MATSASAEIAALAGSRRSGPRLQHRVRPNGLRVDKVRVPLGVIFFLYESRPNVTVDAATTGCASRAATRSSSRGGKEAIHSNIALHRLPRSPMDLRKLSIFPPRRCSSSRRPSAKPSVICSSSITGSTSRCPARRRRVADSPVAAREGAATMPVPRALPGHLSRLRRPGRRSRHGSRHHREREGAATRGLQRRRVSAGARGRRRQVPAASRRDAARQGGRAAAKLRDRRARLEPHSEARRPRPTTPREFLAS